jgi:hypothetical protein
MAESIILEMKKLSNMGEQSSLRIPVIPGESYSIGRSSECELQLSSGPEMCGKITAQRVMREQRERLELVFTPYWEGTAKKAILDPDSSTEIDVGDTLSFGDSQVIITECPSVNKIAWLKQFERWLNIVLFPWSALPQRRRERQQADHQLLAGGESTHDALMARLAFIIDEEDVNQIGSLVTSGRRIQTWVVFTFLVCGLFACFVTPVEQRESITGILIAVGLLLTMVSNSLLCVPSGTASLGIAGFSAGLLISVDQLLAIMSGAVGLFYGYYLEFAWSPVPTWQRNSQNHRGFPILVALFLVLSLHNLPHVPRSVRTVFIGTAIIIALWTIFWVPWLERSTLGLSKTATKPATGGGAFPRGLSADAITLLDLSWRRLRRSAASKATAIVLGLAASLILLNNFTNVSWLKELEASASENESGGQAWVWLEKGTILTENDLASGDFYVLSETNWQELSGVARKNADTFSLLNEKDVARTLERYCVRTLSALGKALVPQTDDSTSPKAWVRADRFLKTGDSHRAEFYRATIGQVPRSQLNDLGMVGLVLYLPTIMLVILGVLVLWRAHSYGIIATVTGLWAIGSGIAPFIVLFSMPDQMIPFHFERLYITVLDIASERPVFLLGETTVKVLAILTMMIGYAALLILPGLLAIMWVWPLKGGRTRVREAVLRGGIGCVIISVVGFVAFSWNTFWPACCLPGLAACLLYHYRVNRKLPVRDADLRHFLILSVPAIIVTVLSSGIQHRSYIKITLVCAFVVAIVLFFCLLWLFVADNLWNVSGGRALSSIVFVLVVTEAFKWATGQVPGSHPEQNAVINAFL